MTSDTPPPLTDKDKVMREDAAWQAAAKGYLALKAESDVLGENFFKRRSAYSELPRYTTRGHGHLHYSLVG
jgi:hypothetical protein